MAIRPLYDRIIVTRTEPERTTASGIVIPDSAGEKPDQGEVIAIGNGRLLANGELRPLVVKAGDRVLFGKYAGQAVKIDGQDVLVLREEDVIAIIEGRGPVFPTRTSPETQEPVECLQRKCCLAMTPVPASLLV